MEATETKKRGKKPACSSFFTCTFVGKNARQIETHQREYHDPEPLLIDDDSNNSTRPSVQISRNPNKEMYFSCLHPDCVHTSITRDSAGRHYRSCMLLHAGSRSASAISISSAALRRPVEITQQRPIETVQQRPEQKNWRQVQRQSPRRSPFPLRRHNIDRRASSSRSAASRSLPADSDSDHPPPGRTTATTAAVPTTATTTTTSADANTTQLLATMNHLTNALTELNRQLNKRARRIKKMGGQMVWLTDQVDDIRSHNASLEVHTNSLRREMGTVERRMEGLVQDNQDVRGRTRGVRSDLGRIGSSGSTEYR